MYQIEVDPNEVIPWHHKHPRRALIKLALEGRLNKLGTIPAWELPKKYTKHGKYILEDGHHRWASAVKAETPLLLTILEKSEDFDSVADPFLPLYNGGITSKQLFYHLKRHIQLAIQIVKTGKSEATGFFTCTDEIIYEYDIWRLHGEPIITKEYSGHIINNYSTLKENCLLRDVTDPMIFNFNSGELNEHSYTEYTRNERWFYGKSIREKIISIKKDQDIDLLTGEITDVKKGIPNWYEITQKF